MLADLRQLVRPRHARWDELGLMSVRSFVLEQLQTHGQLEQHHFGEGADAGVNLILRLPGQRPQLAPVLVAAHYDGDHSVHPALTTTPPAWRPCWR